MKYKYIIKAYDIGFYNREIERWEDNIREYKCRTNFGVMLLEIYCRFFYDYIVVQKIGEKL